MIKSFLSKSDVSEKVCNVQISKQLSNSPPFTVFNKIFKDLKVLRRMGTHLRVSQLCQRCLFYRPSEKRSALKEGSKFFSFSVDLFSFL